MHEMLESIDAMNVAEEQEGWVKLTEEEIVQLNPDVIITTYGYYVENPTKEVLVVKDGLKCQLLKMNKCLMLIVIL